MYVEDKMFISEVARYYNVADSTIKNILKSNNIEINTRGKRRNRYIIDGNIAKIELNRRNAESLWTIIDLDDLDRVLNFHYSWCAAYRKNTDSWYGRASIHLDNKTEHSSHGLYLNYFILFNDSDTELCVDHINHDTLDNRKENLRITEIKHNDRNRKGRNRNNQSGYRNVAYVPSNGSNPYIVQLMINGKNTRIGSFSDPHEAGKYAKEMREKYYGEFAGES